MKPPDGLEKGQDFSRLPVPEFWQGPHDTWHAIKLARQMKQKGFLKQHFGMEPR